MLIANRRNESSYASLSIRSHSTPSIAAHNFSQYTIVERKKKANVAQLSCYRTSANNNKKSLCLPIVDYAFQNVCECVYFCSFFSLLSFIIICGCSCFIWICTVDLLLLSSYLFIFLFFSFSISLPAFL